MHALEYIPVEITMKFHFFVSARILADIAALTEWATYEIERSELEYLKREFPDIPAATYDAALFRLSRKAGHTLVITEAQGGSVVLGGSAVALAIWLLNRTLGETIKEAWLKSDLHARVQDLLLKGLGDKRYRLADAIENQLSERGIDATVEVTDEGIRVAVTPSEDGEVAGALQSEPPIVRGRPTPVDT